ncbi:MAG TPA: hypothetical protein VEX13_15345 [Chloroflexia bacterium]|nr:hypothetical protein [Chloroflexia bacterium]
MSDDSSQQSQGHELQRHKKQTPSPDHSIVPEAPAALLSTPQPHTGHLSEAGSLVGNPTLHARGNQPVRIALMRQMQQTYGNRATRLLVQRLAHQVPAAPVATNPVDGPAYHAQEASLPGALKASAALGPRGDAPGPAESPGGLAARRSATTTPNFGRLTIQAKKVSDLTKADEGKRFRVKPFSNENLIKEGQYLRVDNSDFHWFAGPGNSQFSTQYGEATEVGYQESVVADMNAIDLESSRSEDSGVWYEHHYKAEHEDKWKDEYEGGYAPPDAFTKTAPMTWQLNAGVSASAAIQAWLNGLTIAECGSVLVAVQLDALRQTIGNRRFDELFGSKNTEVKPKIRLLVISSNHLDALPEQFLKVPEEPEVGQKFYFQNVRGYHMRHPAGAFAGENAVYVGGGKWKGFGLPPSTLKQMQGHLYDAYVQERDEDDYQAIMMSEYNKFNVGSMLELKEEHGYKFKDLYHSWKKKDVINPAFIKAEEVMSEEEFSEEMNEHGLNIGPTLDVEKINSTE